MKLFHIVKNILIIVITLGLTMAILGFLKERTGNFNENNEKKQGDFYLTSLKGVKILLDNPLENDLVKSPLTISGRAPGNWFFEASAPVVITNWDGLIIGESYIMTKGEWMTTDYVPFEGVLNFQNTSFGDYGFLILQKDNPSGLSEFDDAVEMKVKFK